MAEENPQSVEFTPEEAQAFMADRGIESLADRPVVGHDGQMVPLAQALATCEPARASIDSTIETIRDLAGEDADILPAMTKHLDRMGERAQSTSIDAVPAEAEKK